MHTILSISKRKGLLNLSYDYDSCSRDRCSSGQQILAIAHVPMQQWRMICQPEEALRRGTMFAELDLPFVGGAANE